VGSVAALALSAACYRFGKWRTLHMIEEIESRLAAGEPPDTGLGMPRQRAQLATEEGGSRAAERDQSNTASVITPAATITADISRPSHGRSPKKTRPISAAITTLDSRIAETAPIGAKVFT
jgi:hypothetical protein